MMLRIHDLSCARGGLPVLEGVSFTLEPGMAMILRGPNGCGKTTLLRTIAGLQPARAGVIEAPADSIAYSAHADGIKATLSVTENLAFWAAVHGQTDTGDAVAQMNLASLASRQAQNLSAGQKRRLGLARLLVTGRPIWVLDEPTVSLDTDSVVLFAQLVTLHLERGGMALIATHIDLGLPEAQVFDLRPHKARLPEPGAGGFDEAFL